MRSRVLLVDDEPEVIAAVQVALKSEAFEIVGATSASEGLDLLRTQTFNVVVSDEEMPQMKGSEFLAQSQRQYPSIPRIMLSGRADVQALAKAVNDAEIFRFLAKPVRAVELAKVIREALALCEFAQLHQEVWAAAREQHAAMAAWDRASESPSSHLQSYGHARFLSLDVQRARASKSSNELPELAQKLSFREREIVQAIVSGKRVKEIAQQFSISTHTVRNHLKAVYRKLNVRSQLELLSLVTGYSSNKGAPT